MVFEGDILMWATVLGLLVGIVWSLRYIVTLDKKIERMDIKLERMLLHLEKGRATPKKKAIKKKKRK